MASIVCKIFRTEGFVAQEIVIKTVVNRRTYGDFDILAEDLANRQCHYMGCAVTENIQCRRVIDLYRNKDGIRVERGGEIGNSITNPGGNGLLPLLVGEKGGQGHLHGGPCGHCDSFSFG